MRFKHTNRPGFLFGLIDFCTAGLFFLFYMPLNGLQDELDYIVGRRTQRYWVAYLLAIPTLFIYPHVWMARIDYCFNKRGFLTLWSDFFVDNPASGRVMEKCGFRDTGAINWCSHLYRGDERPVKVMRLDYAL